MENREITKMYPDDTIYEQGGNVKKGEIVFEPIYNKSDGEKISGKVRFNELYGMWQVIIDGVIYEEFPKLADAIDNINRAGFHTIKNMRSYEQGGGVEKDDLDLINEIRNDFNYYFWNVAHSSILFSLNNVKNGYVYYTIYPESKQSEPIHDFVLVDDFIMLSSADIKDIAYKIMINFDYYVENIGATSKLIRDKAEDNREVFYAKGGGIWSKEEEKKVSLLDKRFRNELKEKGIDRYSYEAHRLWHDNGYADEMRKIFKKMILPMAVMLMTNGKNISS